MSGRRADLDERMQVILLLLAARMQFDNTIKTKADCVRYLMTLSEEGTV